MRSIILNFIFLFIIGGFTQCNSPASGDPAIVLSQFFEALSKKDMEAARKLATKESKSTLDFMEMGLKAAGNSNGMEKYDKSKIVFGDPVINGNDASVPVKEAGSGETVNFSLKKENAEWKVNFSMASMLNIGMQKANEKGINSEDMQRAMEELKSINLDSLKETMQEAMKSLDTVNNLLKEIQ